MSIRKEGRKKDGLEGKETVKRKAYGDVLTITQAEKTWEDSRRTGAAGGNRRLRPGTNIDSGPSVVWNQEGAENYTRPWKPVRPAYITTSGTKAREPIVGTRPTWGKIVSIRELEGDLRGRPRVCLSLRTSHRTIVIMGELAAGASQFETSEPLKGGEIRAVVSLRRMKGCVRPSESKSNPLTSIGSQVKHLTTMIRLSNAVPPAALALAARRHDYADELPSTPRPLMYACVSTDFSDKAEADGGTTLLVLDRSPQVINSGAKLSISYKRNGNVLDWAENLALNDEDQGLGLRTLNILSLFLELSLFPQILPRFTTRPGWKTNVQFDTLADGSLHLESHMELETPAKELLEHITWSRKLQPPPFTFPGPLIDYVPGAFTETYHDVFALRLLLCSLVEKLPTLEEYSRATAGRGSRTCKWYGELVDLCLRDQPQNRPSAHHVYETLIAHNGHNKSD
ncbi:hypothetical protein B0H11DRAFT_2368226 [Mycena galericulata]|nr:hypothetical protein B0H11DRAFT_2368226 [Mycena galericulata]